MNTRVTEPNSIEVIDETNLVNGGPPTDYFTPKLRSTRYHIKTFGDLSKLFLWLSFCLVVIIVLVGLIDKTFATETLVLIWDKIAAVYLVIFGHWLSQKN